MEMQKDPQIRHNHGIFRNNVISVLVLFFIISVFFSLFFSQNYQTVASDLTINNILEAVNKERALRNQPVYITNSKLAAAAQIKASDMIARNYFSHTDPDGNYIWPTIVAQGYSPYLQLGENLAIDFYNTESLVAAWMNSPTHRANVLNEGFEDQGMGLDFGSPASNQHYSSIANTFGTLIKQKNPEPPPAEQLPPKVESETTPIPETKPQEAALPKITETPPVPEPILEPVLEIPAPEPAQIPLRGDSQNLEQSFTTAKQETATETPLVTLTSEPAFAQIQPKLNFNPLKFNRYFALAFGGLLLIVLILDIKDLFKKKFYPLDKKINNLIIIILALIIVAIMYWL